ncbi:hypothetical protein AVEN_149839-1 [Araneus ventricosus]|uniref:Uncharacterized protein n=1 Tax=Araneus ventricosus TaxID=182803 RepID=A0A4Y2DY27_ARAVE|nr:hypothetical protein AVEN_149839-1 [Araneus ventricosus]
MSMEAGNTDSKKKENRDTTRNCNNMVDRTGNVLVAHTRSDATSKTGALSPSQSRDFYPDMIPHVIVGNYTQLTFLQSPHSIFQPITSYCDDVMIQYVTA